MKKLMLGTISRFERPYRASSSTKFSRQACMYFVAWPKRTLLLFTRAGTRAGVVQAARVRDDRQHEIASVRHDARARSRDRPSLVRASYPAPNSARRSRWPYRIGYRRPDSRRNLRCGWFAPLRTRPDHWRVGGNDMVEDEGLFRHDASARIVLEAAYGFDSRRAAEIVRSRFHGLDLQDIDGFRLVGRCGIERVGAVRNDDPQVHLGTQIDVIAARAFIRVPDKAPLVIDTDRCEEGEAWRDIARRESELDRCQRKIVARVAMALAVATDIRTGGRSADERVMEGPRYLRRPTASRAPCRRRSRGLSQPPSSIEP